MPVKINVLIEGKTANLNKRIGIWQIHFSRRINKPVFTGITSIMNIVEDAAIKKARTITVQACF